ncbi:hypothetical protein MPSEU_000796300 [Mayamaea pseudoterrestris]|nr:hypothetical protein MPSEU_000796300 [Mayamaea pseudoterrestris]
MIQSSTVGTQDQSRLQIEKMEVEREERRHGLMIVKTKKCNQNPAKEEQRYIAVGNSGDVDIIELGESKSQSQDATTSTTLMSHASNFVVEKVDAENQPHVQNAAEEILNLHMENIQENAELLSEEGHLLQMVQRETVTDKEMDDYAAALEAILARKEDMILGLQEMIAVLRDGSVNG